MTTRAVAAGTNAVCTVDITIVLAPGLTSKASQGTLISDGAGVLDCQGTVEGREISGPGTITARGFYQGDCVKNAAEGDLNLSIPTKNGPVTVSGRFTANALLSAGPFLVSSEIGDSTGTFAPREADGDCVKSPVRRVRALVTGLVFKMAPASLTVVPYGSQWRYKVVEHGGLAGFEQPDFIKDATFQVGGAAFGSGPPGCPIQSSTVTHWPTNTDILLKRPVVLPPNTASITVGVAIDNDVSVYWNGTLVGSAMREGCASLDQVVFSVPRALLQPTNVLAVRGVDRGSESFLDVRVSVRVL